MVGRTKYRNKAERERIEFCKFYMGCLPCILTRLLNVHIDYHHVVQGFRRLGHMFGYGLCTWHHRGEPWPGWIMIELATVHGPSLAHGKKPYEKYFGDELLLVKTTDYAYSLFKETPWNEFMMPESIAEEIRNFHTDLEK